MSTNASTASSSGGEVASSQMDTRLLNAATSGDSISMHAMAAQDPSILLIGTTLQGNTCLHISAAHGHQGFCMDVVALEESLLTVENLEGETPLLAAVASSHVPVASVLLRSYQERQLGAAILVQDKDGCNALHHAIHCGLRELALELIEAAPGLSKHVNEHDESPMFIAATRNFTLIFEKLLNIPESSYAGGFGRNALHAVVRNEDKDSATIIMGTRPEMARAPDKGGKTPVRLAVILNKTEVLRVFLEHDRSLGYEINGRGYPLLLGAAFVGHVGAARELLKHCPDAPCREAKDRLTYLHIAVLNDHAEFVEFFLGTPQLSKVVNMQDNRGKHALHYAVQMCNPRIVASLLSHRCINATMLDNMATPAGYELRGVLQNAKNLNWNEVIMRISKANPQDVAALHSLHVQAKQKMTKASRKDAKSLTQTYTTNTSLVAILITTITFAAAFTLPGGYSSATGSEGLPIMLKKVAFKVFLISDTLAMCSSFVVAFICIITRLEDYEFLIHYRSFTKKLMWFAYVATTTAFSMGLYMVLAPRLEWLAIAICVVVASLPILTKLLGKWPVLKLRFRLGKSFNSDLLDMV